MPVIGGPLDAVLWWKVTGAQPATSAPRAVSLKLWGPDAGPVAAPLAAQQDEWPLGNLLLTPKWPPGVTLRHPMRVHLPANLEPGVYRLEVQLYDTATLQPFVQVDGRSNAIDLGSVTLVSRADTAD